MLNTYSILNLSIIYINIIDGTSSFSRYSSYYIFCISIDKEKHSREYYIFAQDGIELIYVFLLGHAFVSYFIPSRRYARRSSSVP